MIYKIQKINKSMKHTLLFEQFLNEEFIHDKISKEPIFKQNETMSASEFLRKIKKSPEVQKAIKLNLTLGKGVEAVKYLKKNLPVKLDVTVTRSEWNYGGNLVLRISVAGMGHATYRDAPFSYSSGNSTSGPSYTFGHYFEGIPHPANSNGKPISADMGYGSYKAISNHAGVLEDIVKIFKAYETKYGAPFNARLAKKIARERAKIKSQFETVSKRIQKDYNEMKKIARKLGITVREPRLVMKHKELRMRIDEPRKFRHPDEYDMDATMSKEYSKFEKLQAKITDKLQKFADKHDLTLSISADWSY